MRVVSAPARRSELAWIAPAAASARLVEGLEELSAIHAAEPWRVRVTANGDSCLLSRWREHLDLLAVSGLWCPPERVPGFVADLMCVAGEHGYGRLLGPMVSAENLPPYLAAGLEVYQRVAVLRLDRPRSCQPAAEPAPAEVRPAGPRDLRGVIAVDAGAFDDFWRYDSASLRRYAERERLAVAEKDSRVIGYTLAAVRGGDGTLGRLAVVQSERGRGVGRALICEAVTWMVREGARSVTLSTQEHNMASRKLYTSLGFRELPGMLSATISAPL
jgi:[ribosomal protein S18]-alanine N-acetyltransferase